MDVIRIVDLVDDSTSMIEHRVFEDVEIRGPAMLAPLEGAAFQGCTFDGSFESTFLSVPEGTVQIGVIGLRQVAFRRCRFRNVGILGVPDLIAKFGRDFLSPRA